MRPPRMAGRAGDSTSRPGLVSKMVATLVAAALGGAAAGVARATSPEPAQATKGTAGAAGAGASVVPCQSRSLAFDAADARWRAVPMSNRKRDTVYRVEREDARSVLVARAEGSASFYAALLPAPMQAPASIGWAWQTDALVPGADNRDRSKEDAPLRVIAAFDGDESTLSRRERSQRKLAESLSGQRPPYAMLMYIWSDQVAPETVIPSAHTSQVKMLVVASGRAGLGAWQTVRRDLAADYRRAFGAEPGPLLGVAVLTDTDNTGGKAVGRYADIRLHCSAG